MTPTEVMALVIRMLKDGNGKGKGNYLCFNGWAAAEFIAWRTAAALQKLACGTVTCPSRNRTVFLYKGAIFYKAIRPIRKGQSSRLGPEGRIRIVQTQVTNKVSISYVYLSMRKIGIQMIYRVVRNV